jgi:DNA modification methylase
MSAEIFLKGRVQLCCGDSLHFLRDQPDGRYDSVVTDPPYALTSTTKRWANTVRTESTMPKVPVYARATQGFMGKKWDTGETAFAVEFWQEVLRVLKPGGHVVAFGGTRTYHRLTCAIEDAGFEIRDQLQWIYGSGFPKSHDVSKGIDRAAGIERTEGGRDWSGGSRSGGISHGGEQSGTTVRTIFDRAATDAARKWQGWGTALKPACEPICLARKPLIGTVAANVLLHGVGAINVDGCRVAAGEGDYDHPGNLGKANRHDGRESWRMSQIQQPPSDKGRWPANIILDGSDEVMAAFPDVGLSSGGSGPASNEWKGSGDQVGAFLAGATGGFGDSGSAARFFYQAKADADDRLGSKHPTVKPVDLMQWLVRLVTPKGGLVLDPFAGTGTTAEACYREGMRCMLVERETEYQADIRRRMALILAGPDERARESIKARIIGQPIDHGPLFNALENNA